jgi:hypothetical protein
MPRRSFDNPRSTEANHWTLQLETTEMKVRHSVLLVTSFTLSLAATLAACAKYTAENEPDASTDTACMTPIDNDETVPSFSGIPLPCDVFKEGGTTCVTAHSTVRVIASGYSGPLYQLCKGGSKAGPGSCTGESQDIEAIDGYADVNSHESFCGEDACVITKIYDQSGNANDLEPAPKGGNHATPDIPSKAMVLPVKVNGHKAYGVLIKGGMGYRAGCAACTNRTAKGMAVGAEPQSMYMLTSQKDLVDGCCFDYGNAETSSNNDGAGTMEAVYFGAGVVWGTGYGGKPGPWVMADLEAGVFAGWENKQNQNISTNKALKFDFVTAIVVGDVPEKNCGKGRFMLYGADATGADATFGKLTTMWDGIRPEVTGYNPPIKQGSLILGIGGDTSSNGGGRFYEGATATGPVINKKTANHLHAALVAAKYETP